MLLPLQTNNKLSLKIIHNLLSNSANYILKKERQLQMRDLLYKAKRIMQDLLIKTKIKTLNSLRSHLITGILLPLTCTKCYNWKTSKSLLLPEKPRKTIILLKLTLMLALILLITLSLPTKSFKIEMIVL